MFIITIKKQNKKQKIKKGWMNIHWGNQKWKSRYFVLMGQQKKLYYFENEESSKSKGIISLKNAVIRAVDESLFNKPYW